jgi:hypothetical protein
MTRCIRKSQLPTEYQYITPESAAALREMSGLPLIGTSIIAALVLPRCSGAEQLRRSQTSAGREAVAIMILDLAEYIHDYGPQQLADILTVLHEDNYPPESLAICACWIACPTDQNGFPEGVPIRPHNAWEH